jgi:chromosome segregation ATPase
MSETPSHFVAVCPNCLVSLKVQSAYSGSQVRCKHCEHKFRAFAPDYPAPSSSSADDYAAGSLNLAAKPVERMAVTCPVCSTSLNVRRAYAGKYVQCKKCEHKFLVPNIIEPSVKPRPASSEPDLFDRLYQDLDQTEEPQSESAPAPEPAQQFPEQSALRAERDQLQGTIEELRNDLARTEAERDSALAQGAQIRDEHDRLRSQHDQAGEEHQRLAAELASIQTELGESTPGDLKSLRTENERLTAETEQLQDEVKTIRAELSARGELTQTLAQRDEELRLAKLKIDQLDEHLRSQVARHDHVGQQVRGLREELGAQEAERDRLKRELEQREQAMKAADDRHEQLAGKLRTHEDERSAAQADIERLASLHQAALDEAEQHRVALARRDEELACVNEERTAEIEGLKRRLSESENSRQAERNSLEEQLHLIRDQAAAADSERTELEANVKQLLENEEALRADHEKSLEIHQNRISAELQARHEQERSQHTQQIAELEQERSRHAQQIAELEQERSRHAQQIAELEQERSRHAQQIAELHAQSAENVQLVERLKAEILTLAQTRATPEADLEAAQHEIADLRRQLYETESSKRSMSSLLEGMGIRLH